MQRFVIYKRVSTQEQGKSGLGLEAQSRDIALYLASYAQGPWEVVGEFVEVVSGSDADRPEFAKAKALAKQAKATLLVAKLDRLSRRVSEIAALMEEKGFSFKVAVFPNADPVALHIYAALAEQEREFISRRTKDALRAAKERGKKLGGLRDATMRRNVVVMEQAQDRAARLRSVVQPLRNGNATLREIAAALNSAGVETPRGGAWHPASVQRVLARISD